MLWLTKAEYDKSIADYTEAIRLDVKNAEAYKERGDVRLEKDDLENALADFNTAIKIDPKDADAFASAPTFGDQRDRTTVPFPTAPRRSAWAPRTPPFTTGAGVRGS